MNAQFEGHAEEIIDAMQEAVITALEAVGIQAESYAKKEAPADTGRLRNSISHKVDARGQEVYIGTPLEYGAYVELGTGQYYAGGRQTPWSYQDAKGNWYWTRGNKAQPFLAPAVKDHKQTYQNIIEDTLKGK